MYKITCFATISPENLGDALKGLRFTSKRDCFEWQLDGHIFRIEPFKNQPRDSLKGYRVYFNGSIDGGIYLFDSALGWLTPTISGIEYELYHYSKTTNDWLKDLNKRPSFKCLDPRGIFIKSETTLVIVNDKVNFQIRSPKGKHLKMIECLKRIDCLREELQPVEIDIFSFQKEEVAI
ncbi:hypothetical protein AB3Z07_28005 (plasmid) [Metabacillus halosaccharovorans]|uniref:hypothetical protein n=1 Tax=Metabacillus halosaccharovorans TaxID=930124 RepID=UPI000C7F901F|nr:hypothetical protein [Metabacillus halosaccharovorans]MBU7595883.1 hypothetical protein [Metabacillus halosaccharovorans]PMC36264.1 hypothetical protein CJ195_15755 [Bacillus sp. UMB0899]